MSDDHFGGEQRAGNGGVEQEIAYSLKEHTRNDRTSQANALLAVVLPDKNDSYNYFIVDKQCDSCSCRVLNTCTHFQIIQDNMFNIKIPVYKNDCQEISLTYLGYSSYVHTVKWYDFSGDPDFYINIAEFINNNINKYNVTKTFN